MRSCEDVDEATLSFAEIKALCAGDPRIRERMELDMDVSKLKLLKANHQSQQYSLEDNVLRYFPKRIQETEERIRGLEADLETLARHPHPVDGFAGMTILDRRYTEKGDAGVALLEACQGVADEEPIAVGSYRGFGLEVSFTGFQHKLTVRGQMSYTLELGEAPRGNLTRIDNGLEKLSEHLQDDKEQLANLRQQLENARAEMGKPFPQEEELQRKSTRLAELDALLNIGNRAYNSQDAA